MGRLHGLRGGQVFHGSRGRSKLDMYPLSVRLQLACGERRFDELHLQRGLNWAPWWHMRRLCCRQVQGIARFRCVHELRDRHVFDSSKGRSKHDM
jgi:hypothetical protein